jgi:hypothetical protein
MALQQGVTISKVTRTHQPVEPLPACRAAGGAEIPAVAAADRPLTFYTNLKNALV